MNDSLQLLLRELECFGAENDALATQRHEKMLNITPETGQLLAILILGTRARRILEIGTSNGYSTLWLADAVRAAHGSVVTVEVSAGKAELARQNLERAGLSRWVRQEVMDAGQFLSGQAASQFDMIFLDSDRGQYTAWWPRLQRVLVPGGMLVVDNAVSHAAEMEGFIMQVRGASGWRTAVVPIGNGELLALSPSNEAAES
ncbi:MAG TPA: O-methyltransferase [Lacipirellulaceae bacterium]|nr:O-methyltransferase [Lacipirellulaceae bacterium]